MEFQDCENEDQAVQGQEEEEEEQKESIDDELERSKTSTVRALAEREDPSAKESDDFMIRRFLRARDLDIEKATAVLEVLELEKNVFAQRIRIRIGDTNSIS
ncbi:hypothetical protein V6N13_067274 [Hibiscus sabdariffa]|uniref:CRAL/TRIO N-terminal domain-containing protein n=1 Tax=Hibiscus sabdariffa TaxID=183260 RepID=A0ABR2DT18_9ROSI